MKTSRIALLAALGMFAMVLPAAAAPAVSGGTTDVGPAKSTLIQLAQNRTREINEARGGDFKKGKKAKKGKKSKKGKKK